MPLREHSGHGRIRKSFKLQEQKTMDSLEFLWSILQEKFKKRLSIIWPKEDILGAFFSPIKALSLHFWDYMLLNNGFSVLSHSFSTVESQLLTKDELMSTEDNFNNHHQAGYCWGVLMSQVCGSLITQTKH